MSAARTTTRQCLENCLGGGCQVRNFGFLGGTVMNVNDRPYAACAEYREATTFNPDIVVFMLGTNDSKPDEWKHKERFKQDLIALLDHFAGLPAKPKIWLCTPPWVAKHHPGGHDEAVLSGEIIPVIRAVAAERKLPLIDMHAVLEGKAGMFVDGVHPNAAGCAVLAEAAHKALSKHRKTQKPAKMMPASTRRQFLKTAAAAAAAPVALPSTGAGCRGPRRRRSRRQGRHRRPRTVGTRTVRETSRAGPRADAGIPSSNARSWARKSAGRSRTSTTRPPWSGTARSICSTGPTTGTRIGWGRTCRIGLAISEDGIHFTRHPEPVLYPDNDEWKQYEWEGGCEDLHIIEGEDGVYYMNYTTWGRHRRGHDVRGHVRATWFTGPSTARPSARTRRTRSSARGPAWCFRAARATA